MRDHTKLKVFELADSLAVSVYRRTQTFPDSERFGLQSQVRRAAVSVAANLVEGCARTTQTEYARFVEIAFSSSRELQYEIGLCGRLGFLSLEDAARLEHDCTNVAKALNGLLRALRSAQ